uniref:Uncharacterized protein n=3 Tax=unclassified Prevotella TaxID=2638335 RepID=A0AB33JDY4_9BACT
MQLEINESLPLASKKIYVKPSIEILTLEEERMLCAGSINDSASIGAPGSPNEQNQGNIEIGGPGISGAKRYTEWNTGWD